MTRSRRMAPVQRLVVDREQSAVRELGERQQELVAQEARLQELLDYREQYARAFQDSGSSGLGARNLQDYRIFLSRLNEAIGQQQVVIQQCREQQQQTHRNWLEARTRSEAIGKVMDGYRHDEQRLQRRQEQKDTDERNNRGHRKIQDNPD